MSSYGACNTESAMDEVEWWEFDTPAEMAEQVAGDIAFVIESAVGAHGSARVALPGGNTPDPIYKALLKEKGIAWPKVTLIPSDDRLVPPNDPLSNEGKLSAYFSGKGATIVPLVEQDMLGDYRAAGRGADARLGELQWPLDLICLGMAADGHTASIFPGPDLEAAIAGPKSRRAVGVRPDPMPAHAPVERVTLTGAAIASARTVMIVISGAEKRRVLEQALKEGPLSKLPIGRVIAELDAPIDIFWSAQ
jgi:6-phosphogluconolactonase